MLLEERERRRQENQPRPVVNPPPVVDNPRPVIHPLPVVQPQPVIRHYRPPSPGSSLETSAIYPGDLEQWEALERFEWIVDGGTSFSPLPREHPSHRSSLNPIGVHGGRQPFTRDMVAMLTCQYCFARLNSLADLRFHLSRTNKHPVYACCGRFFKRATDLRKHIDMAWSHNNQVVRVTDDEDLEGL